MAMPTLPIPTTKVAATSLSSGTIGQCFVGMMVSGPKEGEPSYALFAQESHSELMHWLHLCLYYSGCTRFQESADIMAGLKRRALQATSAPHTPATHPSHTPQPHTLATHPSYTRQLHLQLPITATPLSCTPYGLPQSYMGMILHRIPS